MEKESTRLQHHLSTSETEGSDSRNLRICTDSSSLVKIEEDREKEQGDPLSVGKRAFQGAVLKERMKKEMQHVENTSAIKSHLEHKSVTSEIKGTAPNCVGGEKASNAELNFRLDDVMSVLTKCRLKAMKCGEYLVIMKSEFDVMIYGEPYHALMLLFNICSGNFMSRIWNQTVKYGNVTTVSELANACTRHFKDRRLCLGLFENEHEHYKHQFLISQTPVARKISKRCIGTLSENAGANEQACIECMKLVANHKDDIDKLHQSMGTVVDSQHEKKVIPKHEYVDEMNFYENEQSEMSTEEEIDTKIEGEEEDSLEMSSLLEVKIEEEFEQSGSSKGKAQCKICGYATRTRALLARHMTTHSEERPFECSVCQKTYKTIDSLRTHEWRHKDTKRYQCEFCEATFATTGECLNHTRRRHTGEKPHK